MGKERKTHHGGADWWEEGDVGQLWVDGGPGKLAGMFNININKIIII